MRPITEVMWSVNRLKDEAGFTIIEMLVAALLVAAVGGLTFTALGNANHATARERARSQAAALAQEDLDQMRSTSPAALANTAGTSTTRGVDFGGLHFDVTRTVTWQTDGSSSSATCTGSSPPSYLEISTSVSGASLGGLKPVTASSLVAMPAGSTGGALTVTVTDASSNPVANATISASSAGGGTQTMQTNANGCALFTTLPNGTYTVSASKAGYIDPNNNTNPTVTNQHVFTAQTTPVNFTMTQGGTIQATFWTSANGWTQATSPLQHWDQFTASLGSYTHTFGATRSTNGVISPASSITTTPLWPGTYKVYPGGCTSEKYPNTTPITATVTAGNQTTAQIFLVAINPIIKLNNALPPAGLHVNFKRTDAGCYGTLKTPDLGPTDTAGHIPQGSLGVPPGSYTVCAWDGNGHIKTASTTVSTYPDLSPVPSPVLNGTSINITTTNGTC